MCLYFNKKIQVSDSQYTQNIRHFCQENYNNCAIYMIYDKLGFMKVPKDLHPEQIEKAQALINK
jgi:hypothetical protein